MLIIADKRIPNEAKNNLQRFGELVLLKTSGITEESISGHPDIFICEAAGKIIVAPDLPFDIKKISSVAFVGLFFTLSGIAVFFSQVIFDLNTHPSACSANATRQGNPIKSLSFNPQHFGTLQFRF